MWRADVWFLLPEADTSAAFTPDILSSFSLHIRCFYCLLLVCLLELCRCTKYRHSCSLDHVMLLKCVLELNSQSSTRGKVNSSSVFKQTHPTLFLSHTFSLPHSFPLIRIYLTLGDVRVLSPSVTLIGRHAPSYGRLMCVGVYKLAWRTVGWCQSADHILCCWRSVLHSSWSTEDKGSYTLHFRFAVSLVIVKNLG